MSLLAFGILMRCVLFSLQSEMSEGRQGRSSSTGEEEESLAILRRWVGAAERLWSRYDSGAHLDLSLWPGQSEHKRAEVGEKCQPLPQSHDVGAQLAAWGLHTCAQCAGMEHTCAFRACLHLKPRELWVSLRKATFAPGSPGRTVMR